ncbi:hypothetical protein KRR40_21820 [Niabella defluvii]|nr:hypothetical protein KRR40_21820 [Niabella sp. I65]
MMSTDVLQNFYIDDPRCLQIAEGLSLSRPSEIALTGLFGSSTPFVFAASAGHAPEFNHVIVLNESEDAAYFHNTLENITGALDIFYFPSSFKTRKNFRQLNASHVMLRTEALTKLASGSDAQPVRKKYW